MHEPVQLDLDEGNAFSSTQTKNCSHHTVHLPMMASRHLDSPRLVDSQHTLVPPDKLLLLIAVDAT